MKQSETICDEHPRRTSRRIREPIDILSYLEECELERALKASLLDARRQGRKQRTYEDLSDASSAKNDNQRKTKLRKSCPSSITLTKKVRTDGSLANQSCSKLQKSDADHSVDDIPNLTRRGESAHDKCSSKDGSSNYKKCTSDEVQIKQLFKKHEPSTEDFLTFLCLRHSPFLPSHLDFFTLNNITNTKAFSSSEDECVENCDLFTTSPWIKTDCHSSVKNDEAKAFETKSKGENNSKPVTRSNKRIESQEKTQEPDKPIVNSLNVKSKLKSTSSVASARKDLKSTSSQFVLKSTKGLGTEREERPKRISSLRTKERILISSYNEERELEKALKASLLDARKQARKQRINQLNSIVNGGSEKKGVITRSAADKIKSSRSSHQTFSNEGHGYKTRKHTGANGINGISNFSQV